jgi:hypothetical protein
MSDLALTCESTYKLAPTPICGFACALALGCEAMIVSICGPSCEFTPTRACGLKCVLALEQGYSNTQFLVLLKAFFV